MLLQVDLDAAAVYVADLVGPSDTSDWKLAGEGFESVVYEVHGWMVRIGKHEGVRDGYLREVRLLPLIAGHLRVAIPPNPVVLPPNASMPFGAMVYEALPGRTMRPADGQRHPKLALELAETLVALHSIPLQEVAGLGLAPMDIAAVMQRIRAETEDFVQGELDRVSARKLAAWWDWPASFLQFEPRFCHGDPWFENLLVDTEGTHLIAVLDFEGAMIGDPAIDLASVFHMGDSFAGTVLRRVVELDGNDQGLPARTERFRLLRELDFLGYAIAEGSSTEVSGTMLNIRKLLTDC